MRSRRPLKLDSDIQLRVDTVFELALNLLGGPRLLKRNPRSELEVHEMLRKGIPAASVIHLVDALQTLSGPDICEKGLGISYRTFQRFKEHQTKLIDREQSGRAWRFAEIMGKVTSILGSREEAERWMREPAIGLDRRIPIDLLETPAGAKLVEEYLGRIEHGVYT
jgi:putative toxin-antitoxin system antitoxin component (TIGR02293 family)